MVEKIYQPSTRYPYGRVRKDSIAHPIRSKKLVTECAAMMKRMTGNDCFVDQRGSFFYLILTVSDSRQVIC